MVDTEKPVKKLSSLTCPKCGSRWVRTNNMRKQHVCRRCGKIWHMEVS